ncbi:MAG: TRZ/ATZ family hydrolase [Burkholderiaceae bacterium]
MPRQLIAPTWIATVDPLDTLLVDHAVVVDGARIESVEPVDEARRRWPDAEPIELPGHLLIPGLVNVHCHTGMTLLRGAGEDLPLQRWLTERIWPLEKALLGPDFVFDGSVLAIHEMLRGGVTTFCDMYFFPEETARAARTLGMRAVLGIPVVEFPTPWATGPDDALQRGLALRDRLRDEPLIRFSLAPHAPYTVADATFEKIAALAAETGLPIQCHVHETADEIRRGLDEHGCRPLQRLARLGIVGPDLLAIHAVHLDDDDIALLARHEVTVAHCPHSNLKLASGLCPTARLVERGVRVGIGTDSAASNNRLDLLGETRLAALLAKGASGDAAAWPARHALRAATLTGARALGLADEIGSIETGKRADLTAIDLGRPDLLPLFDPVSQLLHCGGRTDVTHVWTDGRLVVRTRQLEEPDAASLVSEVVARSRLWHNRIGEMIG